MTTEAAAKRQPPQSWVSQVATHPTLIIFWRPVSNTARSAKEILDKSLRLSLFYNVLLLTLLGEVDLKKTKGQDGKEKLYFSCWFLLPAAAAWLASAATLHLGDSGSALEHTTHTLLAEAHTSSLTAVNSLGLLGSLRLGVLDGLVDR